MLAWIAALAVLSPAVLYAVEIQNSVSEQDSGPVSFVSLNEDLNLNDTLLESTSVESSENISSSSVQPEGRGLWGDVLNYLGYKGDSSGIMDLSLEGPFVTQCLQRTRELLQELDDARTNITWCQRKVGTLQDELNGQGVETRTLVRNLNDCNSNLDECQRVRRALETQVSELQRQVTGLRNDNDALKDDVRDLERDVNDLDDNLDDLRRDLRQCRNQQTNRVSSSRSTRSSSESTQQNNAQSVTDSMGELLSQLAISSLQDQDSSEEFVELVLNTSRVCKLTVGDHSALVEYNDHHYFISSTTAALTYEDALAACKARGMDLATTETQNEFFFLRGQITDTGDDYWLAPNDIDADGTWTSSGTGQTITDWFGDDPAAANNGQCSSLDPAANDFDFHDCVGTAGETHRYICELNSVCNYYM